MDWTLVSSSQIWVSQTVCKSSHRRERAICMCLAGGHVARYCQLKRKCSVDGCGRFHHQLLHGAAMSSPSTPATVSEVPAPDETHVGMASATEVGAEMTTRAGAAPAARSQVILQVVPVTVHGPKGHRRVNALLDLGSQLSLVTESLATQLGLTGPVQQLRIATIDRTATSTKITRRKIHKLQLYYHIQASNPLTPHYIVSILPEKRISRTGRALRNADTLTQPHNRTSAFQKSFIPSTTKLWNSLPSLVRQSNYPTFKHALNKKFCPPRPPPFFTYTRSIMNVSRPPRGATVAFRLLGESAPRRPAAWDGLAC